MVDEFRRGIVNALNTPLDEKLFEHCACDLLRSVYPTIIWVQGGSDDGMDGSIADGLGEPYPVVITTQSDVIGNLTGSLKSYLVHDRPRRKALLATSQRLTPRRRRNLFARARKLGFTLTEVYDQLNIADLLYRSPEWCRDLLGISGIPPVLSTVPKTTRPQLTRTLVGREACLKWLIEGSADKLLVGQPGSGKTFLLRNLADQGGRYFVIDEDRGLIAAAIRARQPGTLIVDDAHGQLELLRTLRHMRTELGAEYSIWASCWPGECGATAEVLNIPSAHARELELLDRDQIVEIIRQAGIGGPDELVRELVNQADGRPGLAVTLADLCLRGGVREVVRGGAISGTVVRFFDPIIGSRAKSVLAAFALGGHAGMSGETVAHVTEMNRFELQEVVEKLEFGGVILEMRAGYLAVRPPALRHALVRDVLFAHVGLLPIDLLMPGAASVADVALELIESRGRGATVPDGRLIPMLESLRSNELWEAFASLGESETLWVIETHPQLASAIARPALQYHPELVLPLLLRQAVGDQRALSATPEHPLRLIDSWVREALPGSSEAHRRRRSLWKAAEVWLQHGDDHSVGFAALRSVMTPHFERSSSDPGKGVRITINFGGLTVSDIAQLSMLWQQILGVIESLNGIDWNALCNIAEDWAYPGRINAPLTEGVRLAMKSLATLMLRDVAKMGVGHPGVSHRIADVANHLDVDAGTALDPVFQVLYPERHRENWRDVEQGQMEDVRKLARDWAAGTPHDLVASIARIEDEAHLANITWPRWTPVLCHEIAGITSDSLAWAEALVQNPVSHDLLEPFLRAAVEKNEAGWPDFAMRCLPERRLRPASIHVLLTMVDPPPELLGKALSCLEGYAQDLEMLCARGTVPYETLKLLLQHEDARIAGAAAIGTWHAKDTVPLDGSLRDVWRAAIIRTSDEEIRFVPFFEEQPGLAFDWLRARLSAHVGRLYRVDSAVSSAIAVLSMEQRSVLLSEIADEFGVESIVMQLVGDSLELYRQLLETDRLKSFHLTPLARYPEGAWIPQAQLALRIGYGSQQVVHAAVLEHPEGFSWIGDESKLWSDWLERFERLSHHDEEDVRELGLAGMVLASSLRTTALERERRKAVFGIWDR